MAFLTLTLLAISVLIYYITCRYLHPKNQIPGPRPLPLLGNIRDLPLDGALEHQHWLKHKDLYGPISSVSVLGMTLIIIHDKKLAHNILDQSASKTSGRPTMVMAGELCGYSNTMICQSYTPAFRQSRKFLHRELGTKVLAAQFHDVQETEVARQLARVLRAPDTLLSNFRITTAATVLKMAYGYEIDHRGSDALVNMVDRMVSQFSLAAVRMGWAVDMIPALRHLPDWLPGTAFKTTARQYCKNVEGSAYIPYKFAQRQSAKGEDRSSYVSKLIKQLKHEGNGRLEAEDEDAIIWSATSLYGAAADTTSITLKAFTLAMLLYPQVQRKAQEEIDSVVGTNRLPTFSDRENLPYLNAVVKEAIRWWPIAPMGFPHTATESFYHESLHIPKGAYLLPAVWWFLHDPSVYSDPESFDPERFLPPRNEPNPESETFGYGRRVCPGRFFADAGLYLNIVQTLAAFDICKAVDRNGKEIEVKVSPNPGILMYPSNFEVLVKPRSRGHVELIGQLEDRSSMSSGDAGLLEGLNEYS